MSSEVKVFYNKCVENSFCENKSDLSKSSCSVKNKNQINNKILYKGILVYAEQRHGKLANIVYELLNNGRKLADELNTTLSTILIGYYDDENDIKIKSQELINNGADKVYVCNNPVLFEFQDDSYTNILVQLIIREKPEIVLISATNIGRSFAPRIASRIYTGLAADCILLKIDSETRNLQQIRPVLDGKIMATILTPDNRPQISTVRSNIFNKIKTKKERKGEIFYFNTNPKLLKSRTETLGFIKNVDDEKTIKIEDADVVVAGGKGVGESKGFELIKELAKILGGVVAASKAAVDANWISSMYQIGQTGRTISPKIYIACGISGQIQHNVGMASSDIIISINKDHTCPMMQIATYALKGDMYEIIPKIIKKIKLYKKT
ncbi:MAG: electron transfer flavoprotein subunit alpha/FixB family protein [Endomicrobium sp.]|jgi:electron transfer flavoprotein alpha subunit|nr:electron transfer flavoprotein subunit alpha/FixB family protein [Endomicrobium sp.]